jgi:hypothetical protein
VAGSWGVEAGPGSGPFSRLRPGPREWVDAAAPKGVRRGISVRAPAMSTRKLIIAAVLTGVAILAAGITQIVLGRAGH